jgi:hypothetical protein
MVTKALTVMAGKALARRSNTDAATIIDAGLALMREQLSDNVVEHFVIAKRCAGAHGRVQWLDCIQNWNTPHLAEYVEKAKAYYRAVLPRALHVDHAADFLRELRHPGEPITAGQATAMLHVLFASVTGKLRKDEAAMLKLTECAEIFSPANNALAMALELWEPVSTHPVSLALAIKELKANKIFEPNEAELREALGKVETKNAELERDANEWLTRLRATDALMFKTDPDGWRAAHAAANNAEAEAFLVMLPDDEAYQTAINALHEETFDDYGDRRDAAEAPKQIAACDAKAAKRTKKLNTKPKTEEQQ